MKLNDFQYNWYLHFEEENEKSIIGLPFDPYFEAHKFNEEEVLKFVSQSRSLRQLRTRWISDFATLCNNIETRWDEFKKNHVLTEQFDVCVFIVGGLAPFTISMITGYLTYYSFSVVLAPIVIATVILSGKSVVEIVSNSRFISMITVFLFCIQQH